MTRPRIFVSAVGRELGSARRQVAATLHTLGFDTVTQGNFPTGHGELRAWLERQIDGCEGVFQLAGLAYGAEPPDSADPARPWPDPDLGRCPYTQSELLYAARNRQRTWLVEVGPECLRDAPPEQLDLPRTRDGAPPHPDPAGYQAERRALQHAYLDRLRRDNHLRHKVGSEAELQNLVYRLRDALGELRRDEARGRRRLGWALAFIEARRPGIVERVQRRRSVAEARIRAELQPLLTSAGLYQTEGDADVYNAAQRTSLHSARSRAPRGNASRALCAPTLSRGGTRRWAAAATASPSRPSPIS